MLTAFGAIHFGGYDWIDEYPFGSDLNWQPEIDVPSSPPPRAKETDKARSAESDKWARYFLVPGSRDSCDCPNNEIKTVGFGNEGLLPINVKECAPYLETALNEVSFKGELKICESFEISDRKSGHRLRQIFISHGPGQDCPAGCFYDTLSIVYDESHRLPTTRFDQPYNHIFESLRAKRYQSELQLMDMAKSVAWSWLEAKDPDVSRISHGYPVVIDCDISQLEISPGFLWATPTGNFWAVELLGSTSCTMHYRDSTASNENTYKIEFSGIAIDLGATSVKTNFNLEHLNLKVLIEQKVNRRTYPSGPQNLPPPPPPPAQ